MHSRAWLGRAAVLFAFIAGLCGYAGTALAGHGAIVVDGATGKTLEEVNANELDRPASLTKMMTMYLAFQAIQAGRLHMDDMLPVSAHAANKEPTKLGLRAGQTISVHDCILGMITKSANDAATVVAERLGGSEPDFVRTMNAQALMLGMTHTHFASASGLPARDVDYTTARDMVTLARDLYHRFPQESRLFATQQFSFRGHIVRGHNHLMERYPGMDGLKTGFTDAAGFNLASTAVQDGRRIFGVVLGGRTAAVRDDLMAQLLDDGFDGRQTPESLVAAATRPDTPSATRRLLAALSPIGSAQAETLPAAAHRVHRAKTSRHVAAVKHRSRSSERRRERLASRSSSSTKHRVRAVTHLRSRHSKRSQLASTRSGESRSEAHPVPANRNHEKRDHRAQLAAHHARARHATLLASRASSAQRRADAAD